MRHWLSALRLAQSRRKSATRYFRPEVESLGPRITPVVYTWNAGAAGNWNAGANWMGDGGFPDDAPTLRSWTPHRPRTSR